ncbi:MAG: TlpA family protein disulfide reductase [Planctomycetaceae bacterium]|nr:TlpA family protein disulfide reductase [Planctomycetaceae bacterium]
MLPQRDRFLLSLMLSLILAGGSSSILRASDSFAEQQHRQLRAQFESTSAWFQQQTTPYSADALDGLDWLLKTAFTQGWYADLKPVLSAVEEEASLTENLRKEAAKLELLGLAAEDSSEGALQGYVDHLKTIRIRQPNDTLELAYALSAQFQINGDYSAAREVYRRTIDAFFLNEQVRVICERRQAKLLLAGESAPELTAGELKLSDQRGKYVLIDFWATNCAPCLIDLPHLKSVARRFQGESFQILGVSFDTDVTFLNDFRNRQRIDWPTPLLESVNSKARENYRVVTIPSTFLVDPEGKIVLVDGQARDVALLLEQRLGAE